MCRGRAVASVVLGMALAMFAARPVAAFHTVFSYQVDRVEIDGNNFGPPDGVPDFVDDFTDGVLGPNFGLAWGTAHESGGSLFLTNPGTHFPAPDGSVLDLTVVGQIGPVLIADGAGDFTGTAYWVPILPALGHHWHFSLYTFGGSGGLFSETFGLGIRRTAAGLEIDQHLIEVDVVNGIYRNTMVDVVPIADADVTGEIGFRVHVADATNTATTEFSLDGGTTWQSPFPAGTVFVGRTQAQFILSADPQATDASTTTTTTSASTTTTTTLPLSCAVDACRRGVLPLTGRLAIKRGTNGKPDSLSWKWPRGAATDVADFGSPTRSTSYELCLADAAGTAIAQVVSPGLFCHLRPCWTSLGDRGYRFRDRDGSQHGIRQIVLRSGADGRAAITLKAKGDLALPPMPLVLPLTVRLQASNGECWADTFSTTGVLRSEAGKFSGRGD
jgi:hypothetical protein